MLIPGLTGVNGLNGSISLGESDAVCFLLFGWTHPLRLRPHKIHRGRQNFKQKCLWVSEFVWLPLLSIKKHSTHARMDEKKNTVCIRKTEQEHILFLEAITRHKRRHTQTQTQTHTHILCQSWWKQKQSALRAQKSKLLLQWSGNFDHSLLSSLAPTFLCHLIKRKGNYQNVLLNFIRMCDFTVLLTAWSVVVCCEVDAVFWTPGCENKKQWRKDLEKEKRKKIESTFFTISKLFKKSSNEIHFWNL